MKRWPVVILVVMAVLGAVVPGCRHVPQYDSRLTAADSLMRTNPDSALALLESLNSSPAWGEVARSDGGGGGDPAWGEVPARAEEGECPAWGEVAHSDGGGGVTLSTDADRAYYGLLLSQARYKAYVTATSDSTINRAMAYYKKHPAEREKLSRSYIYKGAVMEELGHPDSAMLYYKQAEATAAPDDYFNLGFTKLQMGALYNDYYTTDGQEAVKYGDALKCFKKAKDSVYLLVCLNNLGCIHRESKPDTARLLLLEASALARQLRDTARIVYSDLSLIVLDYYQKNYEEARRIIWEINSYGIKKLDYKTYFTAAKVYARLGIIDTAEIYHNLALENRSGDKALFEMYRLQSLSQVARSKKDSLRSFRLERESRRIEDSLLSNSKKLEIFNTEVCLDRESAEQSTKEHNSALICLIAILVLVMISVPVTLYCNAHRYDQIIADLKKEKQTQSIDLIALQHNISDLKINDEELKRFINTHINMMREVIEACYHLPQGPLAKEIKRIVKYQEQNLDIWEKLYHFLDLEYNDIMSDTMKRYPQLGKKDLLVIALTCMGYSCAQIAIVLDYSSSSGISTIRKRIAAKMGLECLLREYIERYKSKN